MTFSFLRQLDAVIAFTCICHTSKHIYLQIKQFVKDKGSISDRGTSRDSLFAKPVSFVWLVLPHSIVGDKRSDHKDNKLVCFH